MTELFRPSFFQPESLAGIPLAGALLYFYQAGTTTPITVYQDSGLITPHASPVVADTAGIFAPIYLNVSTYKTVLQTAAAVTVQTVDNIGATGIAGMVVRIVEFTGSGTYTPNANMVYCIIEGVGGGGGGGGVAGSTSQINASGGGGSGAYSRLIASKATIGAAVTVSCGAGGIAGASTPANGGAGGDTTVGSTLLVAKGGAGGVMATSGADGGAGGAGGSGSGSMTQNGRPGLPGIINAAATTPVTGSGAGGISVLGAGGASVIGTASAAVAGNVGTRGGGGSGAFARNVAANAAGAAGGAGYVFITEFCSA